MSIVDANIILRYLLDDHVELSLEAAKILEQQTITVPIEVVCEVVYVLQKVYGVNRNEIQQQLSNLLKENILTVQKPVVFLKALEYYSTTTLDFVDTLLWAYHTVEQQQVFTFDHKLAKNISQTAP